MHVRIMTWNIHKCIGFDGRFRPQRVIDVIRRHAPDVLLIQEVDRGVPRSQRLFLDHLIAEEAGYPYHAWSQNHTLKEGGYGNATLSRFPIRRRSTTFLPSSSVGAGATERSRKGLPRSIFSRT